MKRLILSLVFLLCASIYSAPVVIYNTVTKRVIEFKPRANTPDYQGRSDTVIFTTSPENIPLVAAGIPMKYWYVENHNIREMTAEEKAVVDAEIQATIVQEQNDLKDLDKADKILTACILVMLDEINTLRALHSQTARTKAQLKTAIVNKYNTLN